MAAAVTLMAGSRSRLVAILLQRCPVCLEGEMFKGTITMYEQCSVCGHRFMREPGFFQGAMYVSYVLGIATFVVLLFGCKALFEPKLGFLGSSVLALVGQMLLVPILFRYSRVIWAHLNVRTRP